MFLSFLFSFYLSFAFSQQLADEDTAKFYDSFSFVTSSRKEITLSKAYQQANQKRSIFSSFLNIFSRMKAKSNPSQWYYVHIYDNYLSTVQEHVQIHPDDQFIKNTFILYLTAEQLDQISPYCLFKLVESSEKIDEISPFNSTDYLYVKTATDYVLTAQSHFTIYQKINSDSYIVKVDHNKNIQKVALTISKNPAVQTVTTYKLPVSENLLNVGRIQRNSEPLTRGGYLYLNKIDRYVHEHGLTGEGQILTLVDLALDFRHPMFRDDKVEVEFNKEMPDHRKIFYYHSDVNMDEWKKAISEANHGTHVAGTLAGKTITNIGNESINSMFDGSAPDAKIIYAGAYGEVTAAQLEERMNSHGSRISSNSWGDTDKYVNSMNHEYGSLAYRNPQSIFLFANGNHGQGEIGFTAIDPGGSKNILAVAYATNPVFQGSNLYTLHTPDHPGFILDIYAMHVNNLYEVADFIGTKRGESRIIAFDTRDLNDEKIEFICNNVNGSHLVIYYGDTDSDSFINEQILAKCSDDLIINDGMLISANASMIESLIQNKEKVAIVFESLIDGILPTERGNRGSIGPGNKGIMKPDVIAPGDYVLSASSFSGDIEQPCDDYIKCGLASKSGSSMATPNVAGATALIAQYFKSGKWFDSVDLDGATMRALVINSAKHPSESLQPDLVYGHGLVDISSVLPLEDEFGVQITRQKEGEKPSIGENDHLTATIYVKSECTLQVTLSYLDPMLHEDSPIPITRDLDLVVVSPGGSKKSGDHLSKDTQHLSTNEKVIIDAYSKGNYTIHIFSSKFFDSDLKREELRQEFSVVATGNIDNKYIEFEKATVAPCKKVDPDHPDHCLCASNQIGPSCSTTITELVNAQSYYAKMAPMEITRIKFKGDKNISSLRSYHSSSYTYPTIWVSKECHLPLSEYEINGKIGNMKENEIKIPFQSNEICVAVFNNNYLKNIFYHIEVYYEPEKCPDCSKDVETESPQISNTPEDGKTADNGVSKTIFYAVTGILAGTVVILIAVIIFLIIFKKKGNLDFKSDKTGSFTAPLIQSF